MIAAGSFHLHRSYLRGSRRQLEQRVHLSGCAISRDHFLFQRDCRRGATGRRQSAQQVISSSGKIVVIQRQFFDYYNNIIN